jgi:hypothetical protein
VSVLPLRCISPELEAKLDANVFISNAEGVEYKTHLADQEVKVIVPQYGHTQSIVFINRRVMNVYYTWMLIRNASRDYFPVGAYGWSIKMYLCVG